MDAQQAAPAAVSPRAGSTRVRATLGRKGAETRARLLSATRELLKTVSPFQLTVVSIARAAHTASATLYVYFDDVEDLLYELCHEAGADFGAMLSAHPEWFADTASVPGSVEEFIDQFNAIWDRHSHVLLYRNLEADRGNRRFLEERTVSALPVMERLADAVRAVRPELGKVAAQADAVVLFSAVERLAGTRQNYAIHRRTLPLEALREAQIRVISSYLLPSVETVG